jgi:hypothetical protein
MHLTFTYINNKFPATISRPKKQQTNDTGVRESKNASDEEDEDFETTFVKGKLQQSDTDGRQRIREKKADSSTSINSKRRR